jgi:stage II sporulation protein GA (sporulation sigma-E factor processing peptidase)
MLKNSSKVMELIVYVDTLLIENFIINSALLNITFNTLKLKVKIKKLILSSFLGSIYVFSFFISNNYLFTSTIFKLLVAMLMLLILIDKKKINILIISKALITFLLYSIMLAGITYYIDINVTNFTLKYIYLGVLVIYLVYNTVIKSLKDKILIDKYIYDVEIYKDVTNIKVKAFLDTGNGLKEPITKLPVMLLDKETSGKFTIKSDEEYLIPYRMFNGQKGILHGFKPDYIKIILADKAIEEKVIIAFGEDYFSKTKNYNGLLSRGIID